jgi:hypothetical protein
MPLTLQITCEGPRVTAEVHDPAGMPLSVPVACTVEGDDCDQAVEEAVTPLLARHGGNFAEAILAASAAPEPGPESYPAIGLVVIGITGRPLQRIRVPALAINGTVDAVGNEASPLETDRVPREVPSFVATHRLQGLAVNGAGSRMNPAHERVTAELARACTGVPVLGARYLPECQDAIERGLLAAETLRRVLLLRRLAAALRGLLVQATRHAPPMRIAGPDEALVAAFASRDELAAILHWFTLGPVTVRASARVTRPEQGRYSCHCDDARYDFEGITEAKAFGETHVRDAAIRRAGRIGMEDPHVTVETTDRFTEIRGRKGPVQVYIESNIVAVADAARR